LGGTRLGSLAWCRLACTRLASGRTRLGRLGTRLGLGSTRLGRLGTRLRADNLANRTRLCAWHHLRAIQAGLAHCMGQAPGRLRFALGLRQRRPPLVSYASGDIVLGGSALGASGGLAARLTRSRQRAAAP
jgi:hypothetical protein